MEWIVYVGMGLALVNLALSGILIHDLKIRD